ncbi:MAG: SDR family oxidoreductase [Phototrophicaceae bacterium]
MNITFDGYVVIVTGAAHGIGRAISQAFASRGATVYACDILKDELEVTLELCETYDGKCYGKVVDVQERQSVYDFVDEILDQEQQIHIVVNNAGGVLGQIGKPLETVSEEEWDSIFKVNARAPFYFSQAVASVMKQHKFGRIINISSGAGLGVSLTGIQAYASAKAAQIGLTRQLAHELGEWGITVNCIAPGFVLSNPSTEKQWQSYGEEGQKALLNNIALKRLGTPDDIANGVMFLASDFSGWITGQTLSIDGGK